MGQGNRKLFVNKNRNRIPAWVWQIVVAVSIVATVRGLLLWLE